MESQDQQSPHRWQRALVIAAIVVTLLGLAWMTRSGVLLLGLPASLPPALPLLAPSRRGFTIVCLVMSFVLLVISVCGVLFGLSIYAPAAVLLLIAVYADPRRAPVWGRGVAIGGAIVTVAAVIGWSVAIVHSNTGYEREILVRTGNAFWEQPHVNELLIYNGTGIGYGATSVSMDSAGGAGTIVHVYYADDLTGPERGELVRRLQALPGVLGTTVCARSTPGC